MGHQVGRAARLPFESPPPASRRIVELAAASGPGDCWPLHCDRSLSYCWKSIAVRRSARNLPDRLFVVILDFGIGNECRPSGESRIGMECGAKIKGPAARRGRHATVHACRFGRPCLSNGRVAKPLFTFTSILKNQRVEIATSNAGRSEVSRR